ncbi:MAG TPA: methylated-DNA--[protein]-cysteine S-methyltransferase [Nitrospirae bacterium]|nr:methylated-DNA--[protein]-cysteine S-methyltransferase [Nitrospirota bacterium]
MSQAVNKSSLFYDIYKSPLGSMHLIFSGKFLSGISFTRPSDISFKMDSAPGNLIKELTLYFQGSDTHFSQKIKFLTGTDFERKVWLALKEIPFGETMTYKWIAEKIGKPSAARAVGRALSKNPIPVVIPCHRIIESDGSIGGYSSGVNRKIRLLEMEYYSKR